MPSRIRAAKCGQYARFLHSISDWNGSQGSRHYNKNPVKIDLIPFN